MPNVIRVIEIIWIPVMADLLFIGNKKSKIIRKKLFIPSIAATYEVNGAIAIAIVRNRNES